MGAALRWRKVDIGIVVGTQRGGGIEEPYVVQHDVVGGRVYHFPYVRDLYTNESSGGVC